MQISASVLLHPTKQQNAAVLLASIDASEMASEVSALTSVKDEYLLALTSGLYSDENYKKFLDKAYASGLQEYMDGVQKQVDAFLAENE